MKKLSIKLFIILILNVWAASAQTFKIPLQNPSFEQPGNEFLIFSNTYIFFQLHPELTFDPYYIYNQENWVGFATDWQICNLYSIDFAVSGTPDLFVGPNDRPKYELDFRDSVRIANGLSPIPYNNLNLIDENDSSLTAEYGKYFLRLGTTNVVVKEHENSVEYAIFSENVIQQFPCGFKKDVNYTLKAYCRSGRYLNADGLICNPRKLKIFLTNDVCNNKLVGANGLDAFVSEALSLNAWVETSINFTPTQDYTHFVLWADSVASPIKDGWNEYQGSLLIDSIAPISYTYPHVVKGIEPTTALQKGDCFALEAEISSAYPAEFEWFQMNGNSIGQFPTVCPDSTTSYILKAYNQCGFEGYDTLTVTINKPILPEKQIVNKLYPNPIQNGASITLESAAEQRLEVYDTAGRIIKKYNIGKGIQQVPLAVAAGVYYCVFGTEQDKTYRLIVLK